MILIADSGSTKTSWCLIEGNNTTYFQTEGYNPYFVNNEYIIDSLRRSLPDTFSAGSITEVHFYGAGCSEDKSGVIANAMGAIFQDAEIYVEMDLLAAARALLGKKAGFAAILGTGTNTCIYDGSNITHNIDSLGFILGDEGSGGAMGKMLIGDFIRGVLPVGLHQKFIEIYRLTPNEIIDQIYTKPMPNRFCAGFSQFLWKNIHESHIHHLVETAFQQFFENLVCKYPDYQQYSFNCIGSIAYIFKSILQQTAGKYMMKPGTIIRNPIEGLIRYHTKNNY